MNCFDASRRAHLVMLTALAAAAIAVGCSTAPPQASPVDESLLPAAGFKLIVATTTQQKEHLQTLTPGQFRAMERNGVPYYVYPVASKTGMYVGTQKEYQAYLKLHPDGNANLGAQLQAQTNKDQAGYAKEDKIMQNATQRDLSDPWDFWPNFGFGGP
jgi:hypothetical protein